MSTAWNGDWGSAGVSAVTLEAPSIRPVPDGERLWCDAEVTSPVHVVLTGHESRSVELSEGTPVEAKAAAYRVQNSGSRRRGRIKVRRDNHARLRESGGVYAIGVYNPNSRPKPSSFLRVEFVTARYVEDAIGVGWADCSRAGREAGTVPWSVFVDPSEVCLR